VKVCETLKRTLGFTVRILFSIILIAVLAYHIGSADILAQIKAVRWQIIAITVAILSSSVLFVTPRWAAILTTLGHSVPAIALVRSVFVGFAFNQLLPTGFGGDVFRVWRARQLGVPTDIAVHSVLLDRASGVFISFVGAIVLLPWISGAAGRPIAGIIGLTALAGIF